MLGLGRRLPRAAGPENLKRRPGPGTGTAAGMEDAVTPQYSWLIMDIQSLLPFSPVTVTVLSESAGPPGRLGIPPANLIRSQDSDSIANH